HGKMNNNSTFSIQLISGINHGFGSRLKIFGSKGTVSLTNDNQLCFGDMNGQLEELKIQLNVMVPQHLSKEASAYYPAFYPFLEKVYDYVALNKIDEDLPLIEDGHQNQLIVDRIRGI